MSRSERLRPPLSFCVADRYAGFGIRPVKNPGEVEPAGLPVLNGRAHDQPVGPTDHLGEGAVAEVGHIPAGLLGDEHEEVDHMLRLPREQFTEFGILGGNPDRADVQVTLAHHDASLGDEGGRAEPDLVGA